MTASSSSQILRKIATLHFERLIEIAMRGVRRDGCPWDAGSAFRGPRRSRRLGQAASAGVIGGLALGPLGHLPSHFAELVGELPQAGTDLFFSVTVTHGGVINRYGIPHVNRTVGMN
jgi:hypothetical protein